jgi:LysW-gamma-L-lysine/LysW-L-ornithine aminotransferase
VQQENLLETSMALGEQLRSGISALGHKQIKTVRGRGLMTGVEFRIRVTPVLRGLQERGVLALPAGSLVLRFLPPLTIKPEEINRIISALDETLGAMS